MKKMKPQRNQAVLGESQPKKKQRVHDIIQSLNQAYPETTLALTFSTPFELLIALILAAQCTD